MPRAVSPFFAGRETELARLRRSFDSTVSERAQRLVLLGAEAGGGKSRLIREFARQVDKQAHIVIGNCLGLGEAGLPFAPFTAGLRQLVGERGVDELTLLVGERHARQLAWLHPDFGEPSHPESDLVRVRLAESFRKLLEALAAEQPLVWVVEDIHWADQGTRDLLGFLANSLQGAPVLLMASYRIESLNTAQGLRSLVAELGRQHTTDILVLPRLARRDVAAQLEGILGYSPAGDLLNEIYRRGGGVPLFTESMVDGDGKLRPALQGSLAELLSGVTEGLPEVTQQILRAMTIGGTRVGHALLAAVASLDDSDLLAAVRPAIHGNVLVADGDGYAFRHALLRDSVRADVLANEARRFHHAYATALQSDAALSPDTWTAMALAHHWQGAGDAQRAIRSAWDAAREAGGRYAYPEQLQMLEQVLELWDVPSSTAILSVDRWQVLALAANAACWAAESVRGLAHAEQALAQLDQVKDGEKTAAMLLERASFRQQLMLAGEIDDLDLAVELAPASSRIRAEAIGQLCRAHLLRGENARAQSLANELTALAAQLGDEEYAIEADIARHHLAMLDGEDRTVQLLAALDAASKADLGRLEVIAYVALMRCLESNGRHADAIETGKTALVRTREVGQARYLGSALSQNLAISLTAVGRWDEAVEVLMDGFDLDPPPLGRMQLLLCAGHIAIARGDVKESTRILRELHALAAGATASGEQVCTLRRLDIEFHLSQGETSAALIEAQSVPALSQDVDIRGLWPLLASAAKACVDAGDSARHLGELDRVAGRLSKARPVERAHALTFAAELSRTSQDSSQPAWREAAQAWSQLGQPYPQAYACLRLAAAMAAAGDRAGAAEPLRTAAAIAGRLRAEPLALQIESLARRARIERDLAASPANESDVGLTDRELQVLKLVAAGRSNGEIAQTLFISVKTASVHVSNILAKLDVRTRGAAAAAAHRLHLFDPA